ncbi:cadmium-translocating P-type ATPase [Luteolibacter ambystomatis]|uniref:P-type Zn(2+) transporter n=1 Tax=Luteolibacter ambystomatis TaxID=2824561 RepID=A0A975G6T3_9BACT|nr:cation-translocating P-type ATPase [Luteolibacter ambystomatis]QUE50013.1 cadmium-translocating P-type ATPase [Luteolibacter ambystomatis]
MSSADISDDNPHALDRETRARLRLLFAASALMLASMVIGWLRPQEEGVRGALALAGTCLVAVPILRGVITAIRATGFAATQFYMDQYVVLALAACVATGKYLTGGLVAIVLLFGQMLEERTTLGVELALSKLRVLNRLRAFLIRNGREEETDASTLVAGDEVRVRPGESIPADAVVLEGHAMVDQSRITGESMPVEVGPGSEIFAGTSNLNGTLLARVKGAGGETVMGRVQSIIEEAKESEAPIISLAEDYARYYTPLILLIAASVFFFSRDIERAIAVMVVSIPCAFVLASPSAMVSAIAAASRMGLLVKSVRHLESARMVDTIVFDKTGTLTQGKLELEDTLVHDSSLDAAMVLRLAASIESHSNHPVAKALAQAIPAEEQAAVEAFTEHPGLGLEGEIEGRKIRIGRASWLAASGIGISPEASGHSRHSLVLMAVNGRHAATFLLADRIRPEAGITLDRLRSLGIDRFIILSGDREEVVSHIAARTGITTWQSGCLPEDKLAYIRRLRADGQRVMVVGDGLNDAPALAEGDVGVAMGALGNDVTIHTSDVALMSNDLRRLPDLLLLSARTVGVINQNLLCGFLFIVMAITLSSLGYVNPIAAAFFHEFSAFFVIFNSARLLRFDGMEDEAASEPESLPAHAT